MTGSALKDIRESKGITLEEAAEATRLRAGFLQELEEVSDYESIPEVYRKLSFRMYAQHLGVEMETTRLAQPGPSRKSKRLIVPMTNFVRRMGRPPKPPVLDRHQRNRLLTVAKATSAAVVVVLAIGLYSLNAKLARLNVEEKNEALAASQADMEPRPQLTLFSAQVADFPRVSIEQPCELSLISSAPESRDE